MSQEAENVQRILDDLKRNYKDNPEILRVLEGIDISNNKYWNYKKVISAEKILSDIRVMKNVNGQNLKSIIEEGTTCHENLCELVGKTYGKEAENILRERPLITMRDIPNFDIFDKNIRNMIGYGGVHTFLTYYMKSESIITQIANNPEMVRYYKEFEKLTGDFFPPSAIGLENRLIVFDKNKDLIRQIVDSSHQEDYIENLLLYLTDQENLWYLKRLEEGFEGRKIEEDFKAETIEELESYRERREKILEAYKRDYNINKDFIIIFKYFGIGLTEDLKKFLKDYMTFNKTKLTDEEVDLIELYSIFSSVTDKKFKDTFDELLSQRQDVISPVHMRSIRFKIAENYKEEYMESLMTVEKAKEKVERDEAILINCSNSIEANENSNGKSRRYILKKGDNNNIYFADHMQTLDGTKKFRDCTVEEKDKTTTIYTYTYNSKEGQEILKHIMKITRWDGKVDEYTIYMMGDIGFRLKNGEFDKRKCPKGAEKRFDDFVQNINQLIEEAELVPQYNPEEKFTLEEGDVEGFLLYGVHSSELAVTLIRYNTRPTSSYFSYKNFNR